MDIIPKKFLHRKCNMNDRIFLFSHEMNRVRSCVLRHLKCVYGSMDEADIYM